MLYRLLNPFARSFILFAVDADNAGGNGSDDTTADDDDQQEDDIADLKSLLADGDDPETKKVPYKRVEALSEEVKRLRARLESQEIQDNRKKEEEERRRREEQMKAGEWEALYKDAVRKQEAAVKDAEESRLAAIRVRVANRVGLPDILTDRIQGRTEEAMELDAQKLFDVMARPSGFSDGARGVNSTTRQPKTTLEKAVQAKRQKRIYQEQL